MTGHPSNVTVEGNAYVSTLIAGSASESISNGDVTINIGGQSKVGTLIGGCQGFNDGIANYTGKTAVNITGGTVETIYGAGSGRNASIPTFKGTLNISVSGGTVKNIYGSGSAAYVISDASAPSKVNITVTGGRVDNIYAAGLGGDTGVGDYKKTDGTTVKVPKPELMGSLTGDAQIVVHL